MHCGRCMGACTTPASGTLVTCHTRAHKFPMVTLYAAPHALTFINNQIISYSCIAFVYTEALSAQIETTYRKTFWSISITFTLLTSQNIRVHDFRFIVWQRQRGRCENDKVFGASVRTENHFNLLLVKIFGQRKIYYRANNCVTNGFSFGLMSTLRSRKFEKRKSIFIFSVVRIASRRAGWKVWVPVSCIEWTWAEYIPY